MTIASLVVRLTTDLVGPERGNDVSCGAVNFRTERSGGNDGRVYHLGWRVRDHAGHTVDGICTVTVPHDESGKPAGEQASAYTRSAPPDCGG